MRHMIFFGGGVQQPSGTWSARDTDLDVSFCESTFLDCRYDASISIARSRGVLERSISWSRERTPWQYDGASEAFSPVALAY